MTSPHQSTIAASVLGAFIGGAIVATGVWLCIRARHNAYKRSLWKYADEHGRRRQEDQDPEGPRRYHRRRQRHRSDEERGRSPRRPSSYEPYHVNQQDGHARDVERPDEQRRRRSQSQEQINREPPHPVAGPAAFALPYVLSRHRNRALSTRGSSSYGSEVDTTGMTAMAPASSDAKASSSTLASTEALGGGHRHRGLKRHRRTGTDTTTYTRTANDCTNPHEWSKVSRRNWASASADRRSDRSEAGRSREARRARRRTKEERRSARSPRVEMEVDL